MTREKLKETISTNLISPALIDSVMLCVDLYVEELQKQLLPSEAEAWKMEVKKPCNRRPYKFRTITA
jgi:hypothetical protein